MIPSKKYSGVNLLLALVWGLVFCPGASGVEFAGGTGEPNDPYQIATAEQLLAIGSSPDLIKKHYVLTASIDLGGTARSQSVVGWFSGTLDGKGHTIRNLHIEGGGSLGLFGFLERRAEVRNLGLVNVYIRGGSFPAGLASHNLGAIRNCYSTGEVIGLSHGAGGLVGMNQGTVTDSYSTATVTGGSYVGGLVGHNWEMVSSCYATAEVTGDSMVGGLVGNNLGEITESHFAGTVTGLHLWVGGLVGYNAGRITSSYADATVVGHDRDVGGLVGDNGGSISCCHATGSVTSQESVGGLAGSNGGGIVSSYSHATVVSWGRRAGGLAGENTGGISCCYSTGSVEGEDDVGGLVGYNQGKIFTSYSAVAVLSYGWQAGGLVGRLTTAATAVKDCYFLDPLDGGGPDNGVGVPLMSVQMKLRPSFLGWDFWGTAADGVSDPWFMPQDAYPVLAWQTEVTGLQAIPDVKGLSLDQARTALETAGFVAGSISYDVDRALPSGYVIHTSPYGLGPAGATIGLLVSSGGSYDWVGNSGDGTPAKPYQIERAGQLESLIDRPELWDKHFVLSADIDMIGRTYSKALIAPDVDDTRGNGFQGMPFRGVFNGQGHTLRNLTLGAKGHDYVGLLGMIAPGARIENLSLVDADVEGGSGTSSYVGVLAGHNAGTITDCSATGVIHGGKGDGLVGFNAGSLVNCLADVMRI